MRDSEKYAFWLASEKRASNWLNAQLLSRYKFNLKKLEFRDENYLRYGYGSTNILLTCACGQSSDLSIALHCANGGFTHKRHDEIRDTFANMSKFCYDVEIETKLRSLQGKQGKSKRIMRLKL